MFLQPWEIDCIVFQRTQAHAHKDCMKIPQTRTHLQLNHLPRELHKANGLHSSAGHPLDPLKVKMPNTNFIPHVGLLLDVLSVALASAWRRVLAGASSDVRS